MYESYVDQQSFYMLFELSDKRIKDIHLIFEVIIKRAFLNTDLTANIPYRYCFIASFREHMKCYIHYFLFCGHS